MDVMSTAKIALPILWSRNRFISNLGTHKNSPRGSDQKVHVRTPELNRVFTVAGLTLARRPASGAAFGGIVEARCNQNSTIGPFHFAVVRRDNSALSPWQQSRKQVN